MKVVAEAMPLTSLVALVVIVELANRPLAPEAGAVKATVTPLIATLPASSTVAFRIVAKAVFIVALWPLPAVKVMLAGTWSTVTVSVLLLAAVPALV